MTWTATAIGGGAPLQYKFLLYTKATNTTTIVQDGPSNALVWTPPRGGTYEVQVWVRSTGSQAPYEASAGSAEFTVTAGPVQITAFDANSALPRAGEHADHVDGCSHRRQRQPRIPVLALPGVDEHLDARPAVQRAQHVHMATVGRRGRHLRAAGLGAIGRFHGLEEAWRSTGNFVITAGP